MYTNVPFLSLFPACPLSVERIEGSWWQKPGHEIHLGNPAKKHCSRGPGNVARVFRNPNLWAVCSKASDRGVGRSGLNENHLLSYWDGEISESKLAVEIWRQNNHQLRADARLMWWLQLHWSLWAWGPHGRALAQPSLGFVSPLLEVLDGSLTRQALPASPGRPCPSEGPSVACVEGGRKGSTLRQRSFHFRASILVLPLVDFSGPSDDCLISSQKRSLLETKCLHIFPATAYLW